MLHSGRYARAEWLHPVYMGMGNLLLHLGEPDEARPYFDQALDIRRSLNDPQGVANALISLCVVANDQHDYRLAVSFAEQGLEVLKPLDNRMAVAMTRSNLAVVLSGLGDYVTAANTHRESVTVFRDLRNERDLSLALNNLANVLLQMGRVEPVPLYLKEAFQTAHRLGYQDYQAHSLMNYAHLALQKRQTLRAVRLLGAFKRIVDACAGGFREAALRDYEQHTRSAHQSLDERTFDNAWYAGYIMHPEQVAAYALSLED